MKNANHLFYKIALVAFSFGLLLIPQTALASILYSHYVPSSVANYTYPSNWNGWQSACGGSAGGVLIFVDSNLVNTKHLTTFSVPLIAGSGATTAHISQIGFWNFNSGTCSDADIVSVTSPAATINDGLGGSLTDLTIPATLVDDTNDRGFLGLWILPDTGTVGVAADPAGTYDADCDSGGHSSNPATPGIVYPCASYIVQDYIDDGSGSIDLDNVSRVYNNTPATGTYSPPNVNFTATYNNKDAYTKLTLRIHDDTADTETTYALPISPSDATHATISKALTLTLDHNYTYVWGMVDGDAPDFEELNASFTVQAAPDSSLAYGDCDSLITTPLDCIKAGFVWAFVPDQSVVQNFSQLKASFANAFPFAYISDISSIFASDSSSTESVPDVTIQTGVAGEVDIMPADTIRNVIPSDAADLLKGLITMSLWLGLGFFVYNQAKKIAPRN